jgi:hypothetical protein
MDVQVEPEGWEAEAAEIQCLLSDVVQQFLRHLAEPPTGRIRVRFRQNETHPMIPFRSSPADDFLILLTVRDRVWDQFAYQFAHEFCHILCDYERPRCSCNHWIQESLCEMASLFALKQMAVSWQAAPPYPNWREHASSLDASADKVITRSEHRLPDGVALGEWLRVNEPKLRANHYERSLNGSIAVQLLPLFQASPQHWGSIRYMPDSNETFDKFVAEWSHVCPDEHKAFVLQVADLFGIKIENEV